MAPDERTGFSERLRGALQRAGCSLSPTDFAQEFNLRTDGPAITAHAARKWLRAEAIPTQNKLLVLAKWLGLAPQWLRYGDDSSPRIDCGATAAQGLPQEDRILLHDIHLLDARARQIVKDLVASLLRNSSQGDRSGKM